VPEDELSYDRLRSDVEELKKTLGELSQRLNASKKDVWERLSAISGLIQGVVIAAIGVYFTHSYNNQQLQQQQLQSKAQLELQKSLHDADLAMQNGQAEANRRLQTSQEEATRALQKAQADATAAIQRVEVVDKFFVRFGSKDLKERRAAFEVMLALDPKLAAILLESFENLENPYEIQAYEDILLRLQKSLDAEVRRKAGLVLGQLQQPRRIKALTNIFESGGERRNYGIVYRDSTDLSYGPSGSSIRNGKLLEAVQTYCATPQAMYGSLLRPYIERLVRSDVNLATDDEFVAALKKSADDPIMQQIEDSMFDEIWWVNATRTAQELGIRSALGTAVIYDTGVQSGSASIRRLRDSVSPRLGGIPLTGVDEHLWVIEFLKERRKYLQELAGRLGNPRFSVAFTRRAEAFLNLARSGNWDLNPPIKIGQATIE
jgi:chitosanase